MGKDKLKRFRDNEEFENVHQIPFEQLINEGFPLKGKWREAFFKNDNPIVLELGCGKGEYTVGLSRLYPNKNFIGVDVKGARLWRGAKTLKEEGRTNGAFLRTKIDQIERFFDKDEVDEIWITFPDPQPRKSRAKKRLTSPVFLNRYRSFTKQNAIVNLKTDSELLYEYTKEVTKEENLEVISSTNDVYGEYLPSIEDNLQKQILSIKTTYEKIFGDQGFTINYHQFKLFPNG